MAGRTAMARTWLEQAGADLRAAEDSTIAGRHEWSCFQAQQAGEKALKASPFKVTCLHRIEDLAEVARHLGDGQRLQPRTVSDGI